MFIMDEPYLKDFVEQTPDDNSRERRDRKIITDKGSKL